jgi:hypothetical protein
MEFFVTHNYIVRKVFGGRRPLTGKSITINELDIDGINNLFSLLHNESVIST